MRGNHGALRWWLGSFVVAVAAAVGGYSFPFGSQESSAPAPPPVRTVAQVTGEHRNAGYVTDIEEDTLKNEYFRRVLFTAPHMQLVLMALKPGEDIGFEVHPNVDQFLRVERGEGTAVLEGQEYRLKDGYAVVVPAGTRHNIINTSASEPLKLYTIYSPPQHPEGTIHKTKAEAMESEAKHP
jgi:mannose-6-phosphate isomerase-like protein (cupin superfamily)